MSIDNDVALLERVACLNVLGREVLRVLAIGAESRSIGRSEFIFQAGDASDGAYVIRKGEFTVTLEDAPSSPIVLGAGDILDETSLFLENPRRLSAKANESSEVIRLPRSVFQRVLESYPDAAMRLRDMMAARSARITADISAVRAKLKQS